MRHSCVFKCWSVLLSLCLVTLPVWGQETDWDSPAPEPEEQTQTYEPDNAYSPAPETPPPQRPQAASSRSGQKASNFDEYLIGKQDGKREARGKPVWILAGLAGTGLCLCIGVAGIGLAFVVPPSPPEMALMGKSSSYIMGYTEAYKSSARLKNAGYATLGCTFAAIINLVINLATGNNPFEQIEQQ